jgi:hypothetical protein
MKHEKSEGKKERKMEYGKKGMKSMKKWAKRNNEKASPKRKFLK